MDYVVVQSMFYHSEKDIVQKLKRNLEFYSKKNSFFKFSKLRLA